MDRSQSKVVLAEAIREAFSDLFAINTKANDFKVEDVKNKLRTLYAGKKSDLVINNIASTFRALCDYADFSSPAAVSAKAAVAEEQLPATTQSEKPVIPNGANPPVGGKIKVSTLQYHINIVLPDTRDQAVYDSIFKSLREHLG